MSQEERLMKKMVAGMVFTTFTANKLLGTVSGDRRLRAVYNDYEGMCREWAKTPTGKTIKVYFYGPSCNKNEFYFIRAKDGYRVLFSGYGIHTENTKKEAEKWVKQFIADKSGKSA